VHKMSLNINKSNVNSTLRSERIELSIMDACGVADTILEESLETKVLTPETNERYAMLENMYLSDQEKFMRYIADRAVKVVSPILEIVLTGGVAE